MAFTDHVKVMMGADTKGLEQGLQKAEKKASRFTSSVKAKFAGMLGAAVLARTAKHIIDFGASIGDLSDRVGVSAETLQTMQFAAEQNGSSAAEASKAIEKLSKSIGEAEIGSKLYADGFKRLGVELKDTEGNLRDTEAILMDVADGMAEMEDPALRVKTAYDLMGRGGTAMIQFMKEGSNAIDGYNKKLKENGMMLENAQVKQLQAASGELEKAGRQFSIFGAKILPPIIKVLRKSQIGWELILHAIKAFPGNLKILGKLLKAEITDKMDLAAAKVSLLRLQFEKFTLKLNPFADEADIKKNADAMMAAEEKVRIMQAHSQKSFAQRKKELFASDKEAHAHAVKNAETIKRLQRDLTNLDKEGSVTKDDILKKQSHIADEAERELEAARKLDQARQDQTKILERTLERVKALREGGEAALETTKKRHKMEDDIQALMQKGNMPRAEAVKFVKKVNEALQQEERAHLRIKNEQERKLKLKELEADRQENLKQLQEEAKLHQAARAEMENNLKILQLRAQGNEKEAQHLEKKLELDRAAKDIAEQLGIQEKQALDLLQQKLGLEQKITQEKLNQQIEDIQNENLKPGEDLRNMGATARAKALREMDKDERKRARAQMDAVRLQELLNDPERVAKLTDRDREKLEERLERKKNELLTPAQKEQIQKIEKQKKEAKEAGDRLKKELDDKQKQIQQQEVQKAQERKEAEDKAKEKLQELGDQVTKKMADTLDAGEKAIKNAGVAIVNAIDRLRGVAPVINVQGKATATGGSSGSDGGLFDFPEVDMNIGDLKEQLTSAITAMGESIASGIKNMPAADIQIEAPSDPGTMTNDIKIEMDGELQQSTQEAILAALQGKMKNE